MKSKKIWLIVLAVLAVAAIAAIGWLYFDLRRDYKALDARYQADSTSFQSVDAELEDAKNQLSEYEAKQQQAADAIGENAALKEQLEAANGEKARLEAENNALRSEISTLRAKRSANAADRLRAEISLKQTAVQAGQAPAGKVCYLTFDDGPSDNTVRILDILASYNVKATFFVVGTGRMDLLPRMVSEGHTVGLHSMTHNYAQIYASEAAYLADLQAIFQAVKNACGVESRVIRFPGGSSNTVSKKYGAAPGLMTKLAGELPGMGYAYFDWNVDSGDASGNNIAASKLTNNVTRSARNKNAICVLMHDTKAKKTTVDALPDMITGLYAQGYSFAALQPETYGFHHSIAN